MIHPCPAVVCLAAGLGLSKGDQGFAFPLDVLGRVGIIGIASNTLAVTTNQPDAETRSCRGDNALGTCSSTIRIKYLATEREHMTLKAATA
jgi:hypothetical protein